jgi:hypothetical protein
MYGMQVHDGFEWVWVRPTGGEPYQYETKAEAEKMLRICYDMCSPDQVRVHPFAEANL